VGLSCLELEVSFETPAAIVNQLNVAANKVLANPATRAVLEKIGARAEGGSAAVLVLASRKTAAGFFLNSDMVTTPHGQQRSETGQSLTPASWQPICMH
jgi:hypothetical protein